MRRPHRKARWAVVALAAGAAVAPSGPTRGQALAVATGAAGGVMGGLAVSMGVVVARATFQERFLHSTDDLVGVNSLPLILGPATGVTLALVDEQLMWSAALGAGVGMIGGTALGAAVGQGVAGGRTSRWAGGIMGGAAGLAVGVVVGSIVHYAHDEPPAPSGASALRVPIGIRVSF